MPDLTGQIFFNRYRIEQFIFPTPIGKLFRATDTYKEQAVAVFILPRAIANNPKQMKVLQDEYRSFSNRHLATSHGIFQTAQLALVIEEWIDGPSLRDLLSKGPITPRESLVYAKSICAALDALHGENCLHLNLCPELIRIDQNGTLRLSGTGLAAIGRAKAAGYPPLYRAPEQFTNGSLSPAADIYSLAVILYQLTTATWLSQTSAPRNHATIEKIHAEEFPAEARTINKEIPTNYSLMLQWALRKNPSNRLKNATELISALALAVQTKVEDISERVEQSSTPAGFNLVENWTYLPQPQTNPPVSRDAIPLDERLQSLAKQKNRRPVKVSLGAAFIFLLTAGLFSFFFMVRPAPVRLPVPTQLPPFIVIVSPQPSTTPSPMPTDVHGGRIAFTCTRGNYNQICMIHRDGSGLSQLTSMDAGNYYPAFSPDGRTLLFVSNRNSSFDLYAWEFEKKELTQITNAVGNVISPSYSPDSRKILFANKVGEDPTSIWIVNADGLNPHLLYQGRHDVAAAAWSPDGTRIAYAISEEIPQEYQIYIMDADGRNHYKISKGLNGIGGSLDWSPDGSSLLVHAGVFGEKDIFQIDITTRQATQLTDGGNNAGAAYSPDGRYIVFNSQRIDSQADLFIMRSNGENPTQLTNHPEPDWGPQWIP